MEEGNSIDDDIELFNRACLLDELSLLSESVDVLPHEKVHPSQWVEEAVGLLNSQDPRVVLVNLSLVVKINDHTQLLHVRGASIQVLVYVLLS